MQGVWGAKLQWPLGSRAACTTSDAPTPGGLHDSIAQDSSNSRPKAASWRRLFKPHIDIFGPGPYFRSPRSRPGSPKPGGPFLEPQRGTEKYDFVEGSVLHEVSKDFSRGKWFPWYPGSLWVYQFSPNPPRGWFYKDFPQTQKNPGPPWASGGLTIVPLWAVGLLSLCGPMGPVCMSLDPLGPCTTP